MSWKEISSFVYSLVKDGYVTILLGDDDTHGILVQPDALARLYDARETVKGDRAKAIIDGILKLVPLA